MMKEPEEGLAPWERFSDWVHCLCVVTFDLELGQALEVVYPGNAKLSETEKMNICYLAFPDSNSGCMGDTCFHFRMRRQSGIPLKQAHHKYNQRCSPTLKIDSGSYYGFVYFRQVVDKTIPRGYFQKSVVLLTQLPLIDLFLHIVQTIAPEYFENGEPGLEAACHDLDQWAHPKPGELFTLPLMGSVIQCRLPTHSDPPNLRELPGTDPTTPPPFLLPSVCEPHLYQTFQPILPHVQLLWELVLLGEPLVVMASSPTQCSSLVQALVSLIWPLNYCLDYRPFFTIHDSEFKEYTSKTQPPPNLILGVTNPFFAKTLQTWPHILRISSDSQASPINTQKVKKGGALKTIDNKPGVYSQWKPFLGRDKALIKRIQKGNESNRPVEAQNTLLRRYFLELTQSFMIPLERYLASLMPLKRQISPYKSAPKTKQFDPNEFFSTLESSGPALTAGVKGDWNRLYKAFIDSPNFEGWFHHRMRDMEFKLQIIHLEVLCATDFRKADLQSRHEVELVDLVLKLREKQGFVSENSDFVSADLRRALDKQLSIVLNTLDDDTRSVVESSAKIRASIGTQILH